MIKVSDIGLWASNTMLKRVDLQDIANEAAGNFYILLASSVPFEEFDSITPEITLPTNTTTVDLSAYSINAIQSVRLTNAGTIRRLRRTNTRVYDALNFQATPGVPATYARFGKNIELEKIPNSASMTLRIRYWALPALESQPETTDIVIPTPWHELMRWETLYRVYLAIEQYERANMLVAPMPMPRQNSPHGSRVFEYGVIPKLWNDLLRTVRQRENADEDFSINPVVRRYTFSGA